MLLLKSQDGTMLLKFEKVDALFTKYDSQKAVFGIYAVLDERKALMRLYKALETVREVLQVLSAKCITGQNAILVFPKDC